MIELDVVNPPVMARESGHPAIPDRVSDGMNTIVLIHVDIPEDLMDSINWVCCMTGKSHSEVVGECLEAYHRMRAGTGAAQEADAGDRIVPFPGLETRG